MLDLHFIRNGDFQAFTGDLKNEINVLNWLSDIETLEIPGVIEEVNSDMLLNIVTLEDDVLVFFYDPEDNKPTCCCNLPSPALSSSDGAVQLSDCQCFMP